MLSVNLGPLALPVDLAVLLAAGLAAAGAGHLAGWRRKVGIVDSLSEMLLAGVVVARVVFVILWFDAYRGVIILLRVVDGTIKLGQKIRLWSNNQVYEVEGLGYQAKVGILTRVERYLVLAPSLVFNQLYIGLGIIALLANITALQRIWHVRGEAHRKMKSQEI